MWLHICMAGLMTAYRCDVTSVLAAQMACQPTNFCLLLLNAIPYFTYFAVNWIIFAVFPLKWKLKKSGPKPKKKFYDLFDAPLIF